MSELKEFEKTLTSKKKGIFGRMKRKKQEINEGKNAGTEGEGANASKNKPEGEKENASTEQDRGGTEIPFGIRSSRSSYNRKYRRGSSSRKYRKLY